MTCSFACNGLTVFGMIHKASIQFSSDFTELSCRHTGVRMMPGTAGCIMEPPAASEYAVLPVGVAMMSPSPCTMVTCLSFT